MRGGEASRRQCRGPEDLDAERVAGGGVAGMLGRAVAARAGGEGAEEVDLGEELEEVAGARGARLHQVLVGVAGEAGAHEDVEDVVDVRLGFGQRQAGLGGERAGQVRVAAVVIVAAGEEPVGVGVAAGADDVVDAGAEAVDAVPVERVLGDRRHRAEMRQAGPEAVAGGEVGAVQRPGLAGEEALGEIGGGPEVEVADLRAFGGDDAEEMAGRHGERAGVARRHDELGGPGPAGAGGADRREIGRRQGAGRVADHRRDGAAGGGVGRGRVLGFHRTGLAQGGGKGQKPNCIP